MLAASPPAAVAQNLSFEKQTEAAAEEEEVKVAFALFSALAFAEGLVTIPHGEEVEVDEAIDRADVETALAITAAEAEEEIAATGVKRKRRPNVSINIFFFPLPSG